MRLQPVSGEDEQAEDDAGPDEIACDAASRKRHEHEDQTRKCEAKKNKRLRRDAPEDVFDEGECGAGPQGQLVRRAGCRLEAEVRRDVRGGELATLLLRLATSGPA